MTFRIVLAVMQKISNSAYRDKLAVFLSAAIDSIGSGFWLPFALIFFSVYHGIDLVLVGAAFTVGSIAGLAVGASAGVLMDRFGARNLVLISRVIRAISFAAYLLASDPWVMTALVTVTVACERLFYTASTPMIASRFEGAQVDRVIASTSVLGIIGLGAGALAASFLIEHPQGLVVIVVVNSISFAVAAALTLLISRDRNRQTSPLVVASAPIGALWRDRPYLLLCIGLALYILASVSSVLILPTVIITTLHAPAWLASGSIVLGNIVIAVAQTLLLRRFHAYSRRRIVLLGMLLMVFSMVVLLLTPLLATPYLVVIVAVSVVLGGVSEALTIPAILAGANSSAPPGKEGRYSSALQTSWGLAEAMAPVLFTALLVGSDYFLWAALSVISLAAWFVSRVALSQLPRFAFGSATTAT